MAGTVRDVELIRRAVALAREAEKKGNIPIGAVITLDDQIIAEAENALVKPIFHPGRHAEIVALGKVPDALWRSADRMCLYSTLEPCVMCTGSLLLHGIPRVVFGALDPQGGGRHVLPHLPPYYADPSSVPEWIGPVLPDVCDALYERAAQRFAAVMSARESG